MCICLYIVSENPTSLAGITYHGFDVGMWNGVKFVEFELVVRTDVDVSTLVLSAITISWRRKDFEN